MKQRTPKSTQNDKLFPYTTLLRYEKKDKYKRIQEKREENERKKNDWLWFEIVTFKKKLKTFSKLIKTPLFSPLLLFVCLENRFPIIEKVCTYKFKRSEEHTSELQSLLRISYAVFFLININIH